MLTVAADSNSAKNFWLADALPSQYSDPYIDTEGPIRTILNHSFLFNAYLNIQPYLTIG